MTENNDASIMELIFSAPGATITVAVIFLIVVIIFTASKSLREFVAGRSLKFGQFEFGQLPAPQDNTKIEENTAVVPPSSESPDEGVENSGADIDKENELPLEVEGENAFIRMMYAAAYRDREASEIEDAYQKISSLHGRQISDEHLETLRCRLRLEVGVIEAVGELKELEKNHKEWTDPSNALTEYYKKLERYDLAQSHAETAIARATNGLEKAYSFAQMADIISKTEGSREAVSYLSDSTSSLNESGAKANVYEKIADILQEDDWLQAAKALEEALRLNPEKKETRFKLAYLYGERGRKLNSLYHYRILCTQDTNYDFAMNNLGVLYGELGLKGKNIETWKHSANGGHVFSTGNIALSMIDSGFFDEARTLLNTVPSEDRENKRVLYAFNLLSSKPEQEEKELKKYINATKVHHNLMLKAVEQENRVGTKFIEEGDLVGSWKASGGAEIVFSRNEGQKLIGHMFDPPINRASTGLLLSQTVTRYKYNLYFSLNGMTVIGNASPEPGQYSGGLLSIGGPTNRSFFFVMTSAVRLEGLYWSDEKHPHSVEFLRA